MKEIGSEQPPSFLEERSPGQMYNTEFAETRLAPLADEVIDLITRLPHYDLQKEVVVQSIYAIIKIKDPARADELWNHINWQYSSPEDRKKNLKEILLASNLSADILYDELLHIEKLLLDEVEIKERINREKAEKQQVGKDRESK